MSLQPPVWLQRLLPLENRPFDIILWDGTRLDEGARAPQEHQLIVRNKSAFKRLLLTGDAYQAALAYVHGAFDIHGDLASILKTLYLFPPPLPRSLWEKLTLGFRIITL